MYKSEPVFVNLAGQESIFQDRFLGYFNVYKYGLSNHRTSLFVVFVVKFSNWEGGRPQQIAYWDSTVSIKKVENIFKYRYF
jgi:hypothetical protein